MAAQIHCEHGKWHISCPECRKARLEKYGNPPKFVRMESGNGGIVALGEDGKIYERRMDVWVPMD